MPDLELDPLAARVLGVGDDDRPTQASLPFFLPSHQERTSGISMPQAGFGQVTVRAQIQAMTVASVPSASFAFG